MPQAERTANVVWNGNLVEGSGMFSTGSGALADMAVTWASRTEQPGGKTSPEELLAAAHASCYAMALSATLARGGTPPERLEVSSTVALDRKEGGGFKVSSSHLQVRGTVPGLDQAGFEDAAKRGEEGCPISNALRGNLEITLEATLV
jgi:lipoyl-dependent peroxiredoxin